MKWKTSGTGIQAFNPGYMPGTLLVSILMCLILACGQREVEIDRDTKTAIDTIAARQITLINAELDSLCDTRFDSLVQVKVDSIMDVRMQEIELLLQQ